MTVTTQYGSFVTLARQLLQQRGVKVTYGRKDEPVTGQGIGEDKSVGQRLEVNVLFRAGYRRRQSGSFLPSNELTAIMPNTGFEPKPNDHLITPAGKRYPVDDVTIIAPDGFPIMYFLGLRDG